MSPTPPSKGPFLSRSQAVWLAMISRPVLGTLLVLGFLCGTVAWRGLVFVEQELVPLIEGNLLKLLNRPVHLGPLQRYALTEIEFGPSTIPPHTTTLKGQSIADRDQATATSVVVRFNPWTIFWNRTLKLDVVLNRPTVYLDENPDQRWVATQITPLPKGGWLKIKLNSIQAIEATVTLAPTVGEKRSVRQGNGAITFKDNNHHLDFHSTGTLDSGGDIALNGTARLPQNLVVLTARTQALNIAPLVPLLPPIPVNLQSGQFKGHLQLTYKPQKPLRIISQGTLSHADIHWPAQSIFAKAKQIDLDLTTTLPSHRQPFVKGKAFIRNAEAKVPETLIFDNGRRNLQTARAVTGTVTLLGASHWLQMDLRGKLDAGGQVQAQGQVRLPLKQAKLQIQAQNIPATLFDGAYRLPIKVRSGRVDGNVSIQLERNKRPALLGTAMLNKVDAVVKGIPQPFLQSTGLVRLKGLTATFDQVATHYGPIPLRASGSIDPDRGYALRAETAATDVNIALKTLQVETLPFPIVGQVRAIGLRVSGDIPHPVISGQVHNASPMRLDRVPMRKITAGFTFADSRLEVRSIVAHPVSGGTVTGSATLQLHPNMPSRLLSQFQGRQLSGDAIAQLYQAAPGFVIGGVNGTALISGPVDDIQTTVGFQAPQADYPTIGQVRVRQNRAVLQNIVTQMKGGTLYVNGVVADGQVRVNADLPGLALRAYSPELNGSLSGRLAIAGALAGFSTQTARAKGTVQFSQGLSVITDPIAAQIRWDGRQILVDRATAPNFEAQGRVGVALKTPLGPQLTALNLNVLTRQYALNHLPAMGLPQNPLKGFADLQGQLTGTVDAPILRSKLEINDLQVSQTDFESFLVGALDFDTHNGLRLNLGGTRDRINVSLDPQQLPIALDIRRDKAYLVGRRQSTQQFAATFRDIPLLAFNWSPDRIQNLGPVSGLASGDLTLDLHTLATDGSFKVDQPGLGRFVGQSLTGQVHYAKGVGTLRQAELIQGENQYQLDANWVNRADPLVSGRLVIAKANLETITAVAKALRWTQGSVKNQELGQASDATTTPVNLTDLPLWLQLQRLAEVDRYLAELRAQQPNPSLVPNWEKLKGQLAGSIDFSGSLQAGVTAKFDLNGQNWTADPYTLDQVVAKGQWDASGLTVEPLTLTQGESLVSFNGRMGGQHQLGQLTVSKFPIETVADALDLPLNLTGQINGAATLSGQWRNPTLQGQFELAQGTLNKATIQQAVTQFSYQKARLQFDGSAHIDSPEPLRIQGNVPYALPFATVKPDSDQIDIALSVKDQGLALANLFTDQVSWVNGKGLLRLNVTGTLDRPFFEGALLFQNATLQSPTLTAPLAQVNGDIRFNRDRITVTSLTGRYNQGELTASGGLPVFEASLQVANPLSVNLNNTTLDLKGLYRGEVSGNLTVRGSAVRPNISGLVALRNGQVLLSNATATPSPANGLPADVTSPPTTPVPVSAGSTPIEFQNLQVRLGDNVRILQPPVLSFLASGQVDLDGSLDAPRPIGKVRFDKGEVYLFTTLFRVDQQKDNFAQFTPAFGLDPYLNLSLRTTVSEVASGRKTILNEFADPQAGVLGSIESVRVRATVQGRASQLGTRLNDVLELTSVPSRSPTEILTLLSSGVAQSLESGDAQGALVNLASSAFLNRVQSVVDDVLGSRATFRLFPLLTPTKDNSTSILELGAEFGYDVTDRFSLSLLQILTSPNELPQFNISYDITDQFRIRSSVNFQGDAVGILEYRIRF